MTTGGQGKARTPWSPQEWQDKEGVGPRWDDLKFPATAINPPGQASDPDVEATSGLLLFAAAGTELVYALAQMPHHWEEGSDIKPHVHWTKTTDTQRLAGIKFLNMCSADQETILNNFLGISRTDLLLKGWNNPGPASI